MKKTDFSVMGVLALIGLFFLLQTGELKDFLDYRQAKKQQAVWTVESEVDKLIVKKTRGEKAEVSLALAKVIRDDPQRVLVCLVIAHAHLWIDKDDEAFLLDLAKVNSGRAVNRLKELLEAEVVRKAKLQGTERLTKEEMEKWFASNAATRILFLGFPKAQEARKVSLFLKQELEWQEEPKTQKGQSRDEWL